MAHKSQQGAALLSALLILAVAVTLATFLLNSQRLLLHQTLLAINSDRLYVALQGVEDWAINILQEGQDIRKTPSFKHDNNGMQLSGMIYALGGRFNINVLRRTENITRFVKLLKALHIEDQQANEIAFNIVEWLLPDSLADKYYVKLYPGYRAAHKALMNLSELRLIKGITPALYAQLEPYLSALPSDFYSLNIHYASLPLWISHDMSVAEAKKIMLCKDQQGDFKDINDFLQRCANGVELNTRALTLENNYYQVEAKGKLNEQEMHLTSLMQVLKVNNKVQVKIIWQEINSD